MRRLEGRVALVTGGLRGLGRAIAGRFVNEGARVLVTDLDETDGEAGLGADRAYQRMDVTRDADWTTAMKAVAERFGSLSILVNNAGASRTGTIASTSEDDWRFVMDTNALSVFLSCRHAVAAMTERGGAIVNIASARALRTGSTQCAYSASKAAVLSLTESVALHCGETGLPIRCNAICPGVIDTPLMRRHAEAGGAAAAVTAMAALQVMGRSARRARSPKPPSSWRPTRRASSPAPCCRSTAASPYGTDERLRRGRGAVGLPEGGAAGRRFS